MTCSRPARPGRHTPLVLGLLLCASLAARSADAPRESSIADLSIEELLNVQITSVSRKSEKLADAPAAVYVISAEDIRRAGARSLPEALRLAPGVDVESIGGGAYAVGIRGFNGRFANKLLVLQDGRSLYTQLYSGVFWERQQPVLEDIERIEIIRGPGAAVWGANAVNGVINIITKSSNETQGGLLDLSAGTRGETLEMARYGGRIDEVTNYRVFAKSESQGNSVFPNGQEGADAWHSSLAGFRLDRTLNRDRMTLQGEVLNVDSGLQIANPIPLPPYAMTLASNQGQAGGDLLGRWAHALEGGGDLSLQAYVDHAVLALQGVAHDVRDVRDLDFAHHFAASTRQDVVWGLGYRQTLDTIDGSDTTSFDPDAKTTTIANLFAQDDIALAGNALHLAVGAKLERDSETGSHLMPDVRLRWSPADASTVWASASRAVRTPSRAEEDVQYLIGPAIPPNPLGPPLTVIPVATGTHDMQAEHETSYQLGYRLQPGSRLSLDVTVYLSRYSNLLSDTPDEGAVALAFYGQVPYLRLPLLVGNGSATESRGIEAAIDWRPQDWWRLQTSYAHQRFVTDPAYAEDDYGSAPSDIFSVRSSMDFDHVRFDLWYRHASVRNFVYSPQQDVPAYGTMDARLAWSVSPTIELSLVGQNLLQDRHLEFVSDNISTPPLAVSRSAYGSLRVAF